MPERIRRVECSDEEIRELQIRHPDVTDALSKLAISIGLDEPRTRVFICSSLNYLSDQQSNDDESPHNRFVSNR